MITSIDLKGTMLEMQPALKKMQSSTLGQNDKDVFGLIAQCVFGNSASKTKQLK